MDIRFFVSRQESTSEELQALYAFRCRFRLPGCPNCLFSNFGGNWHFGQMGEGASGYRESPTRPRIRQHNKLLAGCAVRNSGEPRKVPLSIRERAFTKQRKKGAWRTAEPLGRLFLRRGLKAQCQQGLRGSGTSVHQVGLEAPLLYGIDGSAGEGQ